MRVLIGCEESQVVCNAFRDKGHEAYSCDLLPTMGNQDWHIQGDIMNNLDGWDMLIAHPECTYLCSSGLHWNKHVIGREDKTEEALKFVEILMNADIGKIAVENPVGCISTRIRKPDQYIQPYEYGHDASKKTGLWLKGLPLLRSTKMVQPNYGCDCGYRFDYSLGKYGCPNCLGDGKVREIWSNQTPTGQNKHGPSKDRWKVRAKTYKGIADAMAEQWG